MNREKFNLNVTQDFIAQIELKPDCAGSLNLASGFLLRGDYDLSRMDRAVRRLYRRHEAMRMIFGREGETLFLTLAPETDRGLQVIELQGATRESRYEEALADAKRRVNEPVMVSGDVMYRFWAYEVAEDTLFLAYLANHVVTDGSSVALVAFELSALYEDPDREDLPPGKGYASFIRERELFLQSDEGESQVAYWEGIMDGYRGPEIPKPQAEETRSGWEYATYTLPLKQLNRIARAGRTSVFNVVLLMHQLVLAEYSGQNDIAVTYAYADRFKQDYQYTVGFLAHGILSRQTFTPESSWQELLLAQRGMMNSDMRNLGGSDVVPIQEFKLSYIPDSSGQAGGFFAGFDVTPVQLHTNHCFGDYFHAIMAVEVGGELMLYPYCDSRYYSVDFNMAFVHSMKRCTGLLLAQENPKVAELFSAETAESQREEEIRALLAQLWQRALESDAAPGGEDNFFDLGGNSFKAFFVLENLPEPYKSKLEMNDFYDCESFDEMLRCMLSRC